MLLTKPIEQPWAYATKQGFKGDAPGLYFRYFTTKLEAEKSIEWMKRKKRWHGPIEHRPAKLGMGNYIMTPKQTRAAVDANGGTSKVARAIAQDVSTVRRWKQFGTEGTNAILLRLLAAGKITIQDVEQANDH